MKRQGNLLLFCLLSVVLIMIMSGCSKQEETIEKISNIIDVVLKDANNVELTDDDGWIDLQPTTRINVHFEGDVDTIFFYFTPTGTETFSQRELIGVMSAYDNDSTGEKGFGADNTIVEYGWKVPDKSFHGHLGIELLSGTVARYESDVVNVSFTDDSKVLTAEAGMQITQQEDTQIRQ